MLSLRAPAKINLFLEVVGRRKDGYHNLNTLFLKVRLFDILQFEKAKQGIAIISNHPHIPKDSSNLVYKAAELMSRYAKVKKGVQIKIIKNIPIGAGLGGGSSDAATALLGLNKLWDLRLPQKELLKIGRKLGADVPLFLIPDSAALGRGRGDRLKAVTLLKKFWILLFVPEIFVSTKQVFKALSSDLTNRKNDVKLLIHALKKSDSKEIGKYLFNRLESVTFRKYKWLAKIKKKISALGVRAVLMSGSGSVIFGIINSREEAIRIKRKLQDSGQVLVVRSL
ncbi:MAG: 4-(cytidine 5'-diphospho)-2-C-methyl-D-erythritol kinase [Candidatus Omnitrophota bacterium]